VRVKKKIRKEREIMPAILEDYGQFGSSSVSREIGKVAHSTYFGGSGVGICGQGGQHGGNLWAT
jgi:hypothetical protein